MFFGGWLLRREMVSPNKVGLIDGFKDNQPITYRQWNQHTNQLGSSLRDGLGIRSEWLTPKRSRQSRLWMHSPRQWPTRWTSKH
jgi:acyl-CoA synthetase (AMP-forming)/AMP-acid ligase II